MFWAIPSLPTVPSEITLLDPWSMVYGPPASVVSASISILMGRKGVCAQGLSYLLALRWVCIMRVAPSITQPNLTCPAPYHSYSMLINCILVGSAVIPLVDVPSSLSPFHSLLGTAMSVPPFDTVQLYCGTPSTHTPLSSNQNPSPAWLNIPNLLRMPSTGVPSVTAKLTVLVLPGTYRCERRVCLITLSPLSPLMLISTWLVAGAWVALPVPVTLVSHTSVSIPYWNVLKKV